VTYYYLESDGAIDVPDIEYDRLNEAQRQLALIVQAQRDINGRAIEFDHEGGVRITDRGQYIATLSIVDDAGQRAPLGL
jgi:hypothetical protein